MKELLIYLAETVACSAALLIAYALLMQHRAPFRWCRLALVCILAVSAVVPALRIPVWPAPESLPIAVGIVETGTLTAAVIADNPASFPWELLLGVLYLAGVIVLCGAMLLQGVRIRRLTGRADLSSENGLRIARVREPIAAFSFLGTVYLPEYSDKTVERTVIAHEASHVRHRHSQERLLMELQKVLMWWNPIAWIVARKLTEVQEFEADREVIASGHDAACYADLLFRQLCGFRPDIANGLYDSLTKKRFKMMTHFTSGSHALLRLTGMLAVTAGLIAAFSFTARAGESPLTIEQPPVPSANRVHFDDPHLNSCFNQGMLILLDGEEIDVMRAKEECDRQTIQSISVVVDNSVIKEYGEKAKNGVIFMETRPFHLKDALILLDGREIDSAQAQRIDNNAIKSIDVLKDETAVERYGARARKGVISITTRHAGEVGDGQAARSEISVTAYPDQAGNDAPALEEVVTVAYPDEAADLRSTKIGRAKPLILLDGREISAEELFSLDKNSIKSIEVLKDETALAQYGEKAKNGVVLVVTKSAAASSKPIDTSTEYARVEVMPRFGTGALDEFRQWMMQRLRYPEQAQKLGIRGRVVARFVVDEEGKIADVEILQSPHESLSQEVIRVIASSPRWTPGTTAGKPQAVRFVLPLDFNMPETATRQAEQTEADFSDKADKALADDPEEELFTTVENMPVFQGGDISDFRNWVNRNMRYPQADRGVFPTGTVVAQFVVGLDGRVEDVKILQSPDKKLSEEVVRVLKRSPAWKPGRQKGKNVKVRYTLPVKFSTTETGTVRNNR